MVRMRTITVMDSDLQDTPLLRLLHLTSPALPIGAYAYSQGLEGAVQAGWVCDEASAHDWIAGLIEHTQGLLDLPVLARLYRAYAAGDVAEARRWSRFLLASRESAELQTQERQLGQALARLLYTLEVPYAHTWYSDPDASYAALFALAAAYWQLPRAATALGYLWALCENQVACAVKLVPLGQSAGARILAALSVRLPGVVARGLALNDEDIGFSTPGLAMMSCAHERQYTRLYRS